MPVHGKMITTFAGLPYKSLVFLELWDYIFWIQNLALKKHLPSHVIPKKEVLRNLKNKYKYCSTYLLFPAIFERTVEPEKFCLSVRKASFYPKIHPSMINHIKISRSHTAFYCDILILWIKPYKLLTTFIPL